MQSELPALINYRSSHVHVVSIHVFVCYHKDPVRPHFYCNVLNMYARTSLSDYVHPLCMDWSSSYTLTGKIPHVGCIAPENPRKSGLGFDCFC